MKYYYIVYHSTIGTGAITLAHNKTENGFNIASGYEYLMRIYGAGVVILSWVEIPESRHLGFRKLMEELSQHKHCGKDCDAKEHGFKLLQGDKVDPPGATILPFKPA
jgi:hypothetical protein